MIFGKEKVVLEEDIVSAHIHNYIFNIKYKQNTSSTEMKIENLVHK